MIAPGGLRLIDDDPTASAPDPKILSRTIQVPPGLPWDQSRAAQLEARHGAPLPMSELVCRVRRLESWTPGAAGRFAAFYVLTRDLTGRLDGTVPVDGRTVRVSFLTAEGQRHRTRWMLGLAVGLGLSGLIAVTSLGAVLLRRAEAEASLGAVEMRAAGKLRSAQMGGRMKAQNRALDAQLNRGAPLRDVLTDLAWASSTKAPDAHIEAYHWSPSLLAAEVRGDQMPFLATGNRRVERSAKPLRPGVWLWGVSRSSSASVSGLPGP